ncbi:patatin-like phospholipase family protein [Oscillospiraceae bacterium CM]|nr:patatin-like phospholipase family protein [Oscillospiraceae bacterium CM]
MRFGIALSGGGTRGAAHVGVLCALEEAGLLPTSVAGTSAGSLVAGLYALGYTPSSMKEIILKLSKSGPSLMDADYFGILRSVVQLFRKKRMTFSGFIKGDKLEKYLEGLAGGKKMTDLRMITVIAAVDLFSRKTIAYTNNRAKAVQMPNVIWKSDVQISAAMRASCAVPAVFQPKKLDGMLLVDGGVTDIVPVDLLIAAGEKNVLGVDVNTATPMKADGNILDVCNQSLSILMSCLSGYRTSGEKLSLVPLLPDTAGLLTFEQMTACLDAGYESAKKMVPEIRRVFS